MAGEGAGMFCVLHPHFALAQLSAVPIVQFDVLSQFPSLARAAGFIHAVGQVD